MKNKTKPFKREECFYKQDIEKMLYENTFENLVGKKFALYGNDLASGPKMLDKNMLLIAKERQTPHNLYLKFLIPCGETSVCYVDEKYWFLVEEHD